MGLGLKTGLLDILFPPLCIGCGEPLGTGGGFCPACWSGITFLDGPSCDCCGLPFAFDPGPGTLCGSCLARPPSFDRARAIFAYDEQSKGPVGGVERQKLSAGRSVAYPANRKPRRHDIGQGTAA